MVRLGDVPILEAIPVFKEIPSANNNRSGTNYCVEGAGGGGGIVP